MLFAALLAGPGPAPAAEERVREYVDEITAASITVPLHSLVFARERTDLAANARDYITLAPIEINRAGKRAYFWTGYLWSTIDRRGREPILAAGDELVLLADGRPMRLEGDGKPLKDHGVGEPPTAVPVRTAIAVLFVADPETLEYASRATDLRIELVHAGVTESFTLWKDARADLRDFVERVAHSP